MKQTAVITGAAGGLGNSFAWEFAARGWDLFLTDRDEESLRVLARGLQRAHDVVVRLHACDLSDDTDRSLFAGILRAETPSVGALVNVAGFDSEGPFVSRDPAVLIRMMRVNMEAGMVLTHSLCSFPRSTELLRVINVASLAAFYPMPFKATYAATKSFVLSSSLALREELSGVATITVLCPAGMPTTPSARRAILDQGALGRLTTLNTSDVVRETIDAAMRGRPIVVPGFLNRAILRASHLIPSRLVAGLIGRRWGTARSYPERRPTERLAGGGS